MQTPTIVVDAGHGGHDPGAVIGQVRESDLARLWVHDLALELHRRGHFAWLTRTGDEYFSIAHRAEIANQREADCFVSVHFNQGTPGATGFQVLHARGSARGQALAEAIWRRVQPATGKGTRGGVFTDASVHVGYTSEAKAFFDTLDTVIPRVDRDRLTHARFGERTYRTLGVLRQTKMPAVLLEVGFLTDPTELERLVDGDHRTRVVSAIADGVEEWLGARWIGADEPAAPTVPAITPQVVGAQEAPTTPPFDRPIILAERRGPSMFKPAIAGRYVHNKVEEVEIEHELLWDLLALYGQVRTIRSASITQLWHMARDLTLALDRWGRRMGGISGAEKMDVALNVAWDWIQRHGGLDALRERIIDALGDSLPGRLVAPLVRWLLKPAVLERIIRGVLELAVAEIRKLVTPDDDDADEAATPAAA